MNLDNLADKYNLRESVMGIVHAGAHLCEEASDYNRVFGTGIEVWWIEGNPAVLPLIAQALASYPNQHYQQCVLGGKDHEERKFNITNYAGMSSSLLEFGTHPEFSPDTVFESQLTVETETLDTLLGHRYASIPYYASILYANMLVMDLQGVELEVLHGAQIFLQSVDFIMTEVNKDEVYVGCSKIWDIDDFLLGAGFMRMETHWVGDQGWGDAFYCRRDI
jgi:FkbM family methyltransferase